MYIVLGIVVVLWTTFVWTLFTTLLRNYKYYRNSIFWMYNFSPLCLLQSVCFIFARTVFLLCGAELSVRHRKQITRKSCVDWIWQNFVQCPDFFSRWIARKSCNHTILFLLIPRRTIRSAGAYSNTVKWI